MINPSQVIIINGNFCTGKSHLLQKLIAELKCQFVSRDVIKEILFEQMGIKDAEWSKKLGTLSYMQFFNTIEKIMKTKYSFIIENNFNPKLHSQKIKTLLDQYSYSSLEIFLEADPSIILERQKLRWDSGERHRGHADNERFQEFELKINSQITGPLNVSEKIVRINTNDFNKVNFEEILKKVPGTFFSTK